jgi:uncharacterized membrane protein YgcG
MIVCSLLYLIKIVCCFAGCERKKLKTKIRYQKPWKNWATFSFGSKRKRGARSKKGGQGSGGSGSRENSGEEGAQGGGEQNGGEEDKES